MSSQRRSSNTSNSSTVSSSSSSSSSFASGPRSSPTLPGSPGRVRIRIASSGSSCGREDSLDHSRYLDLSLEEEEELLSMPPPPPPRPRHTLSPGSSLASSRTDPGMEAYLDPNDIPPQLPPRLPKMKSHVS